MKRRDPEGWLFALVLIGMLVGRLACGAGESRPIGYAPAPEEASSEPGGRHGE